jgi:DNA-binding NarL/FixJ family response regulator
MDQATQRVRGKMMAHYAPGSQSRSVMQEKETIALRLLAQGLTVSQICGQLRCSPYFVRRARDRQVTKTGDTEYFERGKIVVEKLIGSGHAWV